MHCRFLFIANAKSPENLKRGATKRAFIKACFRNFQKQRVFSLFRHLLGRIKPHPFDIDHDDYLF